MALAKAVRDGNEAYYMEHGQYSAVLNDMDVTATTNATGSSTTLADGTTVALGTDDTHKYVMAGKTNVPNHYIMYQKHSQYFPGEIHCEAEKGNAQANWLCQEGLQGTLLTERALTNNYNTYVLEGSGNGAFPMTQVDVSNQVLERGDSCKVTYRNADTFAKGDCNNITMTDGVCLTTSYRSCSQSTFTNSVCGGPAFSCYVSNFNDGSICNGNGWSACAGESRSNPAIFNNSTCNGNQDGTCLYGSFSNNSTCNGKGGDTCWYSTYSHSVCYGEGSRSCAHSSFKNGSVCYALSPVAHPYTPCISSSYDATSYCAGDYCPNGAPSGTAGKKWYRGKGDDWPADRPSELVDK